MSPAKEPLRRDEKYLVAVVLVIIALVTILALYRAHRSDQAPLPGDQKGFYRDCVDRVLAGDAVKPSCRSFEAMRAAYDLDPQNALTGRQAKMASTAHRIVRGDFANRDALQDCVRRGICAPVPLSAPGTDPNSPAGRAAHAEFWHLVRDGRMTAANCQSLDLCRAFVKLGLITMPPPLDPNAAGP